MKKYILTVLVLFSLWIALVVMLPSWIMNTLMAVITSWTITGWIFEYGTTLRQRRIDAGESTEGLDSFSLGTKMLKSYVYIPVLMLVGFLALIVLLPVPAFNLLNSAVGGWVVGGFIAEYAKRIHNMSRED